SHLVGGLVQVRHRKGCRHVSINARHFLDLLYGRMEVTYLPTDQNGPVSISTRTGDKTGGASVIFFETRQTRSINVCFPGFHGRFNFVPTMEKGRRNGDLVYHLRVFAIRTGT